MTFANWTNSIIGIINTVVVPLIFACAFVVFLWGVLNYFFFHGGNEEKRKEGRSFVVWGLLGMVLLFGVWGVVNLLLSTLGFAS